VDELLVREMKTGESNTIKKSKPTKYNHDNFFVLNDPSASLYYVMDEIKKLRQDVEGIKKSAARKK